MSKSSESDTPKRNIHAHIWWRPVCIPVKVKHWHCLLPLTVYLIHFRNSGLLNEPNLYQTAIIMIIHCDVMLSLKIIIQVSFSPFLSCTYWAKFGDGWKNCRIQTTHRDIRFIWDGFNTGVYTLTEFSWFVFADKVRPKTPPVSISDHQKVRN